MVEYAFILLKLAFTTVSILHHPDPEKPFVVEVDALESNIGADLSQWFREKAKPFPITYFSQKLTPAERNYDFEEPELLDGFKRIARLARRCTSPFPRANRPQEK